MSIIEIKNEQLTVGINTRGAELAYINGGGGTEFLWNGDARVWSYRAPILFPICGGLKDDSFLYGGKKYTLKKHGFARISEFSGKAISRSSAEFVLESNDETRLAFPFDFRFTVTFSLENNRLCVKNTVENLSSGEMIFSVGAHEGYACPEGIEDYEIVFDTPQTLDSFLLDGNLLKNESVRIIENSTRLPLKYEYFAIDALVFKNVGFNRATLAHKSGKRKVTLDFDRADYFLLWTKPGANYICLEPWCGIQDSVDASTLLCEKEGTVKLEKGESFTFNHSLECFE